MPQNPLAYLAGQKPDLTPSALGVDASKHIILAAETVTAIAAAVAAAGVTPYGAYETVAASQSDQILGATGGVGDVLSGLLIVPATTAAGAVSIKDGNGSAITVFTGGGTTALTILTPVFIPLGMVTVNATTPGWKVTTGANVSVIGIGKFT